MPSLRKSPPDLLSLPNEILARICKFVALLPMTPDDSDLEPKHISNLRLACKHLCTPATTELARVYLDKPVAMFSQPSLEALAELCNHPLFGPRVQQVVFYPFRFNENLVHRLGYDLSTSMFQRDPSAIGEARKDMNTYLEYLEEEYEFESSGRAAELLNEVFCSLPSHDTSVSISFPGNNMRVQERTTTWKALRPMGFLTAANKFTRPEEDVRDNVLNQDGLAFSLMKMLQAVVVSGCEVSSLSLETPGEHWRDLHIAPPAIDTVSKALTALKNIKIDLHSRPLLRGLESVLRATLPHARGLEKLYLTTFDQNQPGTTYGYEASCDSFLNSATHVLGSITSDALAHVQLEGISIRATDILWFLQKHRHILKKLAIIKVPLIGDWNDLLMWIEQNLHVEKLCILILLTMEQPINGTLIKASPWFAGGFAASGRDEVCLETKELLDYLKRWFAEDQNLDREEYWLDDDDISYLREKFMGSD